MKKISELTTEEENALREKWKNLPKDTIDFFVEEVRNRRIEEIKKMNEKMDEKLQFVNSFEFEIFEQTEYYVIYKFDVTESVRELFGDVLSNAYLFLEVYMEEGMESCYYDLKDLHFENKFDSNKLQLVFINGNKVTFDASEWARMIGE